jgi:uncharacterized protein YdaU (DUF1376 family)
LNYYEHHLGDYDGATAHLSWLEDCAYRRLICLYYRTEAPIPGDMKQACRLVRAASKPERDAVQQVLAEFFVLVDGAWHHDRCDAEIGEYQEGEPDREARRENARERQRRSRERRKALFETLRSHNIVPPFDTKTPELEALLSRATSGVTSQPVTRDKTATHTPDTRHQTPDTNTAPAGAKPPPGVKAESLVAEGVDPRHAADWLAVRKAKRLPLTASSWERTKREAAKAGLTPAQAVQRCAENGWAGFGATWDAGSETATHLEGVLL